MRLLVFSDSHGVAYYMRKVLEMHPEADKIIFLGDGEADIDNLEYYIGNKPVVKVKGNCDPYSDLKALEIIKAAGQTVYITHGYAEHVKAGLTELKLTARGYGANIVLYGHTHRQESFTEDGVYYMNPGSISERYYGMIDITPKGIMLIEARADY